MTKKILFPERQVGHLTPLRGGHDISRTEYIALTAQQQLNMIRLAQGRKKHDLIIESQRAEQLVPQLHPQELYLTINELGTDYSIELLALASTDQITTLWDLDCWDGDHLSPVLSLQWLGLLLEMGEDQACTLMRTIEPELLALFLKKHLTITRGIEAYDDDNVENARRLESLYDVDYKSEDAAKIIGALLRIWQEHEQGSYLLVMEMIRSENLAILEEEVFQARNSRLLDLGLIPASEAKAIYGYIDPREFKPGGKSDFRLEAESLLPPTALLNRARPDNLLAEAMATGLDHDTASELLFLVNRKMSADGTDISSSADVAAELQNTYDILNLALEYLAGHDVTRAEQIFRSTYLLHLFQLGHSLIKKLQIRAGKLLDNPVYPFLDYPELLFIDAFLQRPASLYREATTDKPNALHPIRTMQDLQLVEIRLAGIEALARMFNEVLPFSLPDPDPDNEDQTTLSGIFMTAVANRLLEGSLHPQPLSKSALAALKNRTIVDAAINRDFATETQRLFEKIAPECLFFCSFCMELWKDFFLAYEQDSQRIPFRGFLILDEE